MTEYVQAPEQDVVISSRVRLSRNYDDLPFSPKLTKEYAEEKHGVMRAALNELYGEEVGSRIPLLYGGSVNPENAPELIQRENIDGLFIGRSAWQADKFEAIIRTVLPLWREK